MEQYVITFDEIRALLIEQQYPEADIAELEKAFEFAKKLHSGQYRVSEEPYIIHPMEVVKILIALRADKHTLMAGFLHDILEDTDTKPEELKELFGEDVLNLVQGVTKLGKLQFKSTEERQAENFRRMLIAMASDVRIILLKLADRLHNMRTLNYMTPVKQQRIAQETLDIFAPLANRLGVGKIKAELEDLSLKYLHPDKYYEIAQLVSQKKAEREMTVKLLIDKISKEADVKVEQNDFQEKLSQMAGLYGVGPQELLKQFGQNPEFISSISQQIVNDKVREFLFANNKIEYVEVKPEDNKVEA